MKRLREARQAAGGAEGVTIPSLTPREKRILITKSVGDYHRKVTASGAYFRGFIATGTWMPVWHLMQDHDGVVLGPSNVKEDSQVNLQHLPEYRYVDLCTREKILPLVEEVRKKKKEAEAECERLAVERKELLEKEAVKTRAYVEMAERMMDAVYEDLISTVTNHILLINEETGLEEFIIGGSWSSLMIANTINSISDEEENRCRVPVLEANDVDVYHGAFSTEAPEMIVFLDQIKYTQVDEFQWEINTVKCDGLSAENFLANNDLNVTASCFHVDMSTEKLKYRACFTVFLGVCLSGGWG